MSLECVAGSLSTRAGMEGIVKGLGSSLGVGVTASLRTNQTGYVGRIRNGIGKAGSWFTPNLLCDLRWSHPLWALGSSIVK
jgi:hypothetical protein